MSMEGEKYREIRCPNCGKLIAKILHENTGMIELVCDRGSCRNRFYVVDTDVYQNPPEITKQIFNNRRYEIPVVQ